ncbi:MAG TPA: hypothetical protein VFT39_16660 [Vicinamibacterales bacterium]|nr:hypothetical protein [Vicinamibacterales bacterium]
MRSARTADAGPDAERVVRSPPSGAGEDAARTPLMIWPPRRVTQEDMLATAIRAAGYLEYSSGFKFRDRDERPRANPLQQCFLLWFERDRSAGTFRTFNSSVVYSGSQYVALPACFRFVFERCIRIIERDHGATARITQPFANAAARPAVSCHS